MPELLVNLDVEDLEKGVSFYTEGLGFQIGRRFRNGAVELRGAGAPLYLLKKRAGSLPFQGAASGRSYQPHWTPVHLDLAVADVEAAIARAEQAGATAEGEISEHDWGRMALMRDPFGHGFCFLQWKGRGYHEIADPPPPETDARPTRNIEAKYRSTDLAEVERRALAAGARLVGDLAQDQFFVAGRGARLKLRIEGSGTTGELIGYRRSDSAEARISDYRLHQSTDPAGLRAALEHALGTRTVVKKRRRLLLLQHTRIHLDLVERLGTFVELETVIRDQPEVEARAELARIAEQLDLRPGDIVARAYVDLLDAE